MTKNEILDTLKTKWTSDLLDLRFLLIDNVKNLILQNFMTVKSM